MSSLFKATLVSIFALAAIAVLASPASATTICVPGFHAGCPDNGINVAMANLEFAMDEDSSDGIADQILIGEHTYTDVNAGGSPGTLQPTGTDPLEVIGSGTDKTFITSAGTGNQFVVNLYAVSRTTNMSNLTVVVPASFQDDGGAGIQAGEGTFDHVNIESRNEGADGAPSLIGDTIWRDSRIYAAAGGTIGDGIGANPGVPSNLQIIRTTIEDSIWGVDAEGAPTSTVLKQSRVVEPIAYGARVSQGARLTVENSIFETGGQAAISAETSNTPLDADISVSVKNSTFIAGTDPDKAAIEVKIGAGLGSHDATVTVADSILRGFNNTWEVVAPAGPGIGLASLTFTDSNLDPVGLPSDSPVVNVSDPGNINVDPQFVSATDYHLKPGSPSIDAGDPAPGGILEDFAGTVRPLDGDGDGTRVRDQGAFEAAEIPTCATDPALCPKPPPTEDKVAPKISKLKFKAPGKRAGSLKFALSEAAKVKVMFKPTPAGKGKQKRKSVKLTKSGKAGANQLKIKRGKLKSGRYRLSIVATDAAGNRSKASVRKVKVKTKGRA